jgi:general secretion pathway protein M
MMPELSPPMRRFAAIGLLLVVLALAWSILAAPLLAAHGDALGTIERLRPVIERGRASVHDTAALRIELQRLKQRPHATGGLLAGTNEPIAAAQLQERLKTAVDHVSGDLRSTQVLQARDDGAFRRVTVKAQLSVDLPALQHVVYELEAAMPYLFLDDVEIAQRPAARGSQPGDDPLLDVSLELSGYMRKST